MRISSIVLLSNGLGSEKSWNTGK